MAIARGAIVCRRRRVVPSIISRLRLTVLLPGLSIVLRLTVLLLGLSIVLLRLRVFLLGLSIDLLRLSVFLLVPLGSPQCQNKLGQQDYGLRKKKCCSRHQLNKKCLWKTHDWSWNYTEYNRTFMQEQYCRFELGFIASSFQTPCRNRSGQNTLLRIFCS